MRLVTKLFHIAIKTPDLDASKRFYSDVMGLEPAPRPDVGFEGAWFRTGTASGDIIIHLYAGDTAREPDGSMAVGSGVIDHISIEAHGFTSFRALFEQHGLAWRENILEEIDLWQLFVYDPSGIMIELTFRGSAEDCDTPTVPPERKYCPRENFFLQR